jgi:hypothetical protein
MTVSPQSWCRIPAMRSRDLGFQEQAVPFTNQTRLTFDVILPLWGPHGPHPSPTGPRIHQSSSMRYSAKEQVVTHFEIVSVHMVSTRKTCQLMARLHNIAAHDDPAPFLSRTVGSDPCGSPRLHPRPRSSHERVGGHRPAFGGHGSALDGAAATILAYEDIPVLPFLTVVAPRRS